MHTIVLITFLLAPWGVTPAETITIGSCSPRNGGCVETAAVCAAFKHQREITYHFPDPYLGAAHICRVEVPND